MCEDSRPPGGAETARRIAVIQNIEAHLDTRSVPNPARSRLQMRGRRLASLPFGAI